MGLSGPDRDFTGPVGHQDSGLWAFPVGPLMDNDGKPLEK